MKQWVSKLFDSTSMSCFIAASETQFYGIMINMGTNNTHTFWYFLRSLLNFKRRNFKKPARRECIVMDNASIHKTAVVKSLARDEIIRMLTIPSYSPTLNPVETVIHAFKIKVRKHYYKLLTPSLIANITSEIEAEGIGKYVKSQQKEVYKDLLFKLKIDT